VPVYDYACPKGCEDYEVRCSIADRALPHPCPLCGEHGKQVILTVPAMPKVIVVDYPGSKKHKAGFVHSHGDKSATKTQVGFGGAVNRSHKPVDPIAALAQPEPLRFRKRQAV
jgi:putative FmdB family regulatory protein